MKNTYADQANKIIKRYKLRLGENLDKHDPLAMKGLEQELNALKGEQEAFKLKQQEDNFNNQFFDNNNDNNLPQYEFGNNDPPYSNKIAGEYIVDDDDINNDIQSVGNISNINNNFSYSNYANNSPFFNEDRFGIKIQGIDNTSKPWAMMSDFERNTALNTNIQGEQRDIVNPEISDTDRGLTPYNPTLGGASPISLAAGLAGNALLYKSAKPSDINYDRVSAEEIDLSPEREEAKRQADLTRNISLRNARGLGLNAGAAATLATASQADIQGKLGSSLEKSYLNEALSNAQSKQRADQINTNISMREQDSRLREKDAVDSIKQQAIQGAIGNMNTYFSDVQKGRQYNAYLESKDQIYNRYEDPNQGWFSKLIDPNYINRTNPEAVERYRQKE